MRALLTAVLASAICAPANAQSWTSTKDDAADEIYFDQTRTFYCGCELTLRENNNAGSGIIDPDSCMSSTDANVSGAIAEGIGFDNGRTVLDWEHVVPASLTPARQMSCWVDGSRTDCERNSPEAREIIFDLHNLVPSVGTINRIRLDNRYVELDDDASDFGICSIEDTGPEFEPPACKRGDVARIWLYMSVRHSVVMDDAEVAMYQQWSAKDPVSPWESARERRIAEFTGVNNPFIRGVEPTQTGACAWEDTVE
jgi:deoxyribonuclease-1